MPDMLFPKRPGPNSQNEPKAPVAASLNATQVVANLAQLDGWQLDGDGADVAIEKRLRFADFAECLAFANALGWIARRLGHPPARLSIEPDGHVLVRWSTSAVAGLSPLDFEAARQVDALSG